MMYMVKFFTSVLGLRRCCFAYAVLNAYNDAECLRWLSTCREVVREIIIDTAVHKLFHDYNLRDYPTWYLNHYISFVRRVTWFVQRNNLPVKIWYVVPDIPVDYDGREDLYPFNIERTLYYVRLFLEKYVDRLVPAEPIAVIQGRKDDVRSVIETYRRYRHLYDRFELVGIGPTCHSKNYRKLAQLLLAVERTVARPYHAFGIHYNALKLFMKWNPRKFYSFDSTAYYWHTKKMVSSSSERGKAFIEYIEKLASLGIEVPIIKVIP